jgi:hypothetical protein
MLELSNGRDDLDLFRRMSLGRLGEDALSTTSISLNLHVGISVILGMINKVALKYTWRHPPLEASAHPWEMV